MGRQFSRLSRAVAIPHMGGAQPAWYSLTLLVLYSARGLYARRSKLSVTASMTNWPPPSSGTPIRTDCSHCFRTTRRSRKPVGVSIGIFWNGDISTRSQSTDPSPENTIFATYLERYQRPWPLE